MFDITDGSFSQDLDNWHSNNLKLLASNGFTI